MSLNQFFITFLIAMLIGFLLSNLGKLLFSKTLFLYKKLTFRHVFLTPYTPKRHKKDIK